MEEDKVIEKMEQEIEELKRQISLMRGCSNCKHLGNRNCDMCHNLCDWEWDEGEGWKDDLD